MGIGNGVFHPADFARAQRQRGSAAAGPRLQHARHRRQSWLCARADRELRARQRVRLAHVAARARRAGTRGPRRACDAEATRSEPGARRRARPSLALRQHRSVPAGADSPVFRLFLRSSRSRPSASRPSPARRSTPPTAIPLALATSALAAYLLGSTAGILVGGFLASQTAHHDRVAAVGLAIGGALMLLVALVPGLAAWAVALFALTGFALGATGPSRDMIVRAATPSGASGRVYGFVYSGLDLGATIAPVAVGALSITSCRDSSSWPSPCACSSRSAPCCRCAAALRRAAQWPRRNSGEQRWISASPARPRWSAPRARAWGAVAPKRSLARACR